MSLTPPTPEQAAGFLGTVALEKGFMGTILSPSSGSQGARIMDLERMERFLEARPFDDFVAAGYRLSVNYVDFGLLADWLEDAVGDQELSQEVRILQDSGEVFGVLAPKVKALLIERIAQCRDALGIEREPDSEPTTPVEP